MAVLDSSGNCRANAVQRVKLRCAGCAFERMEGLVDQALLVFDGDAVSNAAVFFEAESIIAASTGSLAGESQTVGRLGLNAFAFADREALFAKNAGCNIGIVDTLGYLARSWNSITSSLVEK